MSCQYKLIFPKNSSDLASDQFGLGVFAKQTNLDAFRVSVKTY
jgi:hypothetical protein